MGYLFSAAFPVDIFETHEERQNHIQRNHTQNGICTDDEGPTSKNAFVENHH